MSKFFDSLKNALTPRGTNSSENAYIGDLIDQRRRALLSSSSKLLAASSVAGMAAGCATGGAKGSPEAGRGGTSTIGFKAISASDFDGVRVPEGYTASVLIAWGDPIGDLKGMPAFKFDASNDAADQALQSGTHHDGMKYFPLAGSDSKRGLLVMNHEYPDHVMQSPDGIANWNLAKVRKSQHSLGASVLEVEMGAKEWKVVRPSKYARRVHGNTPMRVGGPAAGTDAMKTLESPSGRESFGTFANCANGWTPWGTYLTCEENFHFFMKGLAKPTPDQKRYGVSEATHYFQWGDADPRFDISKNPNEANHFGWVVEIDPFDPSSLPVKRTAMGRKKQEGAAPATCKDGRVAFYMGDDEAFEYIYKFVTARAWNATDRAANRDLLDNGTLYAAKFAGDGAGEWLELTFGKNGLTPTNGFASQADVLIRARQAADKVGATKMDRPEWTAVDEQTGKVYCTLTNNSTRGTKDKPGVDAANPRGPNRFGSTITWQEQGNDHAATKFQWEFLALAGDPNHADPAQRGTIKGDLYASPDGLLVDSRGILWVQTDMSPTSLNKTDHVIFGNNQMLAVDPVTRETKRFLTSPRMAEVTGACMTPDGCTMFVNIQHPGESRASLDPKNPRELSNWPDQRADGRPRSATVIIRKNDGGVIGT
jgi:uncharacterized protein